MVNSSVCALAQITRVRIPDMVNSRIRVHVILQLDQSRVCAHEFAQIKCMRIHDIVNSCVRARAS